MTISTSRHRKGTDEGSGPKVIQPSGVLAARSGSGFSRSSGPEITITEGGQLVFALLATSGQLTVAANAVPQSN